MATSLKAFMALARGVPALNVEGRAIDDLKSQEIKKAG